MTFSQMSKRADAMKASGDGAKKDHEKSGGDQKPGEHGKDGRPGKSGQQDQTRPATGQK